MSSAGEIGETAAGGGPKEIRRTITLPGPVARAADWFEGLFDPFAAADGAPPQSFGAFFRWLLSGAGPAVWLMAAVSLALGVTEAAAAWSIGLLIDLAGAAPEPATFFADNWPVVLAVGLFLVLARPVLMIVSGGVSSLAITPGLFQLGIWRLHRHTLGQSVGYFQNDFAGRIAQKETQTANSLSSVVNEFLNAISYGLSALLGAALILGIADWRLALILVAWFGGYVLLIRHFLPRIRIASRQRADVKSALSGQYVDQISHMETVKLFAHTGREEDAALEALRRYRTAALDFGRTAWIFRAWLAILSGLLPVTLIGTGFWLWQSGMTTLGDVTMAGLIAMRLAHMSGWISFVAMGIFTDVGVIEDGMKTLAKPHDLTDAPGAVTPAGSATGAVSYEDVTFRYGRTSVLGRGGGLDHVSLSIAPGERVALVGPSGAGKSTMVATLLRLHDVEGGRVTLDGHDLRDLSQDWLRRQVATVTQEPALFNRSALDNILYGRPDANRAEVEDAAHRAQAHEFIADIRDPSGREGYAAHLGERGVKLSGGQRQRIAIARAILKDAPILVLDEATSALDSEVEAEIQTALEVLMVGRTVLAIAHRLSTIQAMDRIVVLDHGRIVEDGNHDALIARGGLYARLWLRQSGGFLSAAAE
ncbi:MAG: ABC transporter ATP-binding protein [Pseudomonadota bacterium]